MYSNFKLHNMYKFCIICLHEIYTRYMPKLFLTDTFVKNARCPASKTQELYWDNPRTLDGRIRTGAIKGLGIRVTSNGSVTFVHSYMFNGKRYRHGLGDAANMNVASARLLVNQRENQISEGENPEKKRINPRHKHGLTVKDILNRYYQTKAVDYSLQYLEHFHNYVTPWHKPVPRLATRRGHNIKQSYLAFGLMFMDEPMVNITPSDIEAFMKQFSAVGTYNKVLAVVKAIFNWAIRMQLIDMRNPCDPFDKRKFVRRKREYEPAQIEAIARLIFNPTQLPLPAISGEGATKKRLALEQGYVTTYNEQMIETCNFMGVLFLTLARPIELMRAEFSHFDLDRLIWHKHNTKGMKLSKSIYEYEYRSVPIHTKVADLIRVQRERWPHSKYVFPLPKDSSQMRDNFRKGVLQFRKLEGVPDYFQMYDLKRIGISLMLVGQGVRREDVSHYVDHRGNIETTMIYNLGLVDPMRPVANQLGKILGV